MQAHAVLPDKGFLERAFFNDDTSVGREIGAREEVEKFRYIYASFVRSAGALSSIAMDRVDDSGPITRPVSVQAEETGAPGSIYRERCHATVERHFLDGFKERRICVSNGIASLK